VYNYPWGVLLLFDYDEIRGFSKVNFYNYIINLEKEAGKKIPAPNN
jgi:hypothetical protein